MCCGLSAVRPLILRRYERSRVLKPKLPRVVSTGTCEVDESHLQVVAEVTVVDDSRVKLLCVGHDNLVDVLSDHACSLAVLWVDCRHVSQSFYHSPIIVRTIFIQIFDHGGKVLLRLLVEIRNSDTSSEDRVIGMFGGEVRSGLSGEVLKNE